MSKQLHYWYEFASPYSCLTAMRIEGLAKDAGVEVAWHPFLLGAIYKMLELPTPPMQLTPAKTAYMWLDVVREAKRYGFSFQKPSQFPRAAVLASRVALVGRQGGKDGDWCPEFSRRVYEANFIHDQDIARPDVVAGILNEMGLKAEEILQQATSVDIKNALRAETDEAFKKEIFGVPTFFARGELFWGNDRLERALEAAAG